MSTSEETPDTAPEEHGDAQKRSIPTRVYDWLDERMGLNEVILPILTHPVPKAVNWWYVLGSATLTAFVVQVVTGVALAMAYTPSTESAYQSLQFISTQAPLGSVIRGMHYWGAAAMVVLIVLHACRVFLMGSFKYPREVNWLTGAVLLLLTLAMAFSGQLLRWDQTAYWSVSVAAAQAERTPLIGNWLGHVVIAGDVIGGATLTRFFATHVFLIPALLFGLIGVHLYLVIKDGISEPPVPGKPVRRATYKREYNRILREEGEPFFPDAVWKDVIIAVVVVGVILALAIVVGPSTLDKPPDPTQIEAYPRPDWYFLSYFAVLALIPPAVESYVILGAPLLAGFAMLVLPFIANQGERAPSRRPWAVATIGFVFTAVVVLTLAGARAPWSPLLGAQKPQALPARVLQGASPEAQHGAQIFQQKDCVSCHMVAGVGGQRGPDLTHVGTRLTRDELTWRILGGGNNMPAYGGNISPQDLQNVLTFLQLLK
jgi:ubiquinol-cytochrome c reductase cytochrome b subunit